MPAEGESSTGRRPAPLTAARLGPGLVALAASGIALVAGSPGAALFLLGAALGLFAFAVHAHWWTGRPPAPAPAVPEAGETYRRLLDAIPTPILLLAGNGRLVHANPAAHRALPRLPANAPYAGVLRAPEWIEAVAASLSDRQPRRIAFVASPGRARALEAQLTPLVGKVDAEAEGGLLVRIEDRTEARRVETLRSDFIANVSHELRTPLASVIGYIETLQHHAHDDPEARDRFLAIMAREAGRMQRLVDELMSLSRIEMTEHVRPEAPCAIGQIAAESAAALSPVAAAEGVTLEVPLPAGGPLVLGDRDQLHRVFSNLIDNAIRHGGAGTHVRIAEAQPSRAYPNLIGITVSDTGPGIRREDLPRLTERFYRIDTARSRGKRGTGLGLAIVKHILNRHEGRLEVVSTLGEGSAFTVWLPRHAEAA